MNEFHQQTAPAQAPPGWYPDPAGTGGARFWDGIEWSQHQLRPEAVVGSPMASPRRAESSAWFVTAGWVCAVVIPLIGLIISCTMISRGEEQGKWMLALTLVAMFAFATIRPYQ